MRITKRHAEVFYVPNDPDKSWVKIKHLKINEVKRIEEKVNNMTYGADDLSVEMNPYERVSQFSRACLVDWGNFYDVLGKPIAFDKKMLETVAEFEIQTDPEEGEEEGNIISLYEWIDECRIKLTKQVKEAKAESAKN